MKKSPVGTILLTAVAVASTVLLFAAAPEDSREAAALPPAPADLRGGAFLRGMTITCPRAGQIWGSPFMSEALDQLRPLGVEWVSIHPYARIERDGTVRFRPASSSEFLASSVERVRNGGMRLFWKPHLAYWGNFTWRGEIDFGSDAEAWSRFFETYREFIVDQATFAQAQGVPLFAVGVELEGSVRFEEQWRAILAAVRRVYHGEITYAANWDRLESVPFWDAVDLIGVQAYFPLSEAQDPTEGDLRAGWSGHLQRLRHLSQHFADKPVLFAEIGYNRSSLAARTPWDYASQDTVEARALRQRLIAVALDSLEREPYVRGLFWWKWMPGPSAGRSNFSMRDPEAMEALARTWGASRGTGEQKAR
ncbi:MAG: hypothetical protein KDD47_28425 [Acidobacteria bacterium]|nr:hypothetical protein [Acidobacteriota bacterium]